MVIEQVLN